MTSEPTDNKAPGVPNASHRCVAQGCISRADANDLTPNPACLKGCVSPEYASFQHKPDAGEVGSGFEGQTGDIAAHEPTREEQDGD